MGSQRVEHDRVTNTHRKSSRSRWIEGDILNVEGWVLSGKWLRRSEAVMTTQSRWSGCTQWVLGL